MFLYTSAYVFAILNMSHIQNIRIPGFCLVKAYLQI